MKGNILFVGLDYEFTKSVARELSNVFDMFFLDVNDLIEYSLIDVKNVKDVCGIEYLEKEKKRVALSVSHYENTVINFPYSVFIEKGMSEELSKSTLTIFLNLNKQELTKLNDKNDNSLSIELITFKELSTHLERKVDISVKCNSIKVENWIESVVGAIENYNRDLQ